MACAPGWTIARLVVVFVETPTSTPAVLSLETSVLDGRQVLRSFTSSIGIQISDSP